MYPSNEPRARNTVSRGYARISKDLIKPLCFAPLELTDGNSDTDAAESAQNLGVITLSLFTIRIDGSEPVAEKEMCSLPGDQAMHERSKKAGVHCVRLGETETCRKRANPKSTQLSKKPFARFIFRYSPIDMLRANGIAPLPVQFEAREPLVIDPEVQLVQSDENENSDADAEEMRSLEERLEALKRKKAGKDQ